MKRVATAAALAALLSVVLAVPTFAFEGDPNIDRLGSATQNVTIAFLGWPLAPAAIAVLLVVAGAYLLLKQDQPA